MFNLIIFILAICILANEAAVIRTSVENNDAMKNSSTIYILTTTSKPELNTTKDEDLIITTTETLGDDISKDEEATIWIVDQTLLDAPAELSKSEAFIIDLDKSGKLLLLSTPKIAEKPKQLEENLEEDEENTMVETVTQIARETTTVDTANEEITTALNVEDNNKNVECENSAAIAEYQPKEALNINIDSFVLEESEADYALVESDALKGSYTDVDSELHLQPIVQSVEIVPSTLDDTLLINYVQTW